MGKSLYITDVDFKDNAIVQEHQYVSIFVKKADTSTGLARAVLNANIPKSAKVGFKNSAYWERYKCAISLERYFPIDADIAWDTSYSGQAYFSQNVTINTDGVQLMIAPADGSTLTEKMLEELNSEIFFIDL